MSRNRGIDYLKGIGCIIIAFMWHYRHFGVPMPLRIERSSLIICRILRMGFEKGWIMVELFFIMSGYVIAFRYKNRIINKLSFRDYIERRLSVLWPPMIITLLCVTLLEYIYRGCFGEYFVYKQFGLKKFLLNMFMIDLEKQSSFNGPCWYVCVLFVLYVIYYLQTRFLAINNLAYYLEAICLSVVGWGIYCKSLMPLFRGMAGFYIGVILAEVTVCIYRKLIMIIWGVGGGILLLYLTLAGTVTLRLQMMTIFIVGPLCLFIIICLFEKSNIFFHKEHKSKIGEYSFLIYMWHFPMQLFLALINRLVGNRMNFASVGAWLIYCVLTFVWIWIYNKICERYRNKLKEYICNKSFRIK